MWSVAQHQESKKQCHRKLQVTPGHRASADGHRERGQQSGLHTEPRARPLAARLRAEKSPVGAAETVQWVKDLLRPRAGLPRPVQTSFQEANKPTTHPLHPTTPTPHLPPSQQAGGRESAVSADGKTPHKNIIRALGGLF